MLHSLRSYPRGGAGLSEEFPDFSVERGGGVKENFGAFTVESPEEARWAERGFACG